MRNTKNYSFQNGQKAASSHRGGGFRLSCFLGFIITLLYLWGKVQIDFVLRENDRYEQKIRNLQRETDDLRIQINHLRSYARIVGLAEKRGMTFVSASDQEELPVDMKGIDAHSEKRTVTLQYAGVGIVGMERQRKTINMESKDDMVE